MDSLTIEFEKEALLLTSCLRQLFGSMPPRLPEDLMCQKSQLLKTLDYLEHLISNVEEKDLEFIQ